MLSVIKHLKLVDLVYAPTRVAENSFSQIDVLMTTDKHCFDVKSVFPFSGSDHHLIVSYFYSRGMHTDTSSHQLVVVRNYQKLDMDKLDEVLTCDDIWDNVFSLMTLLTVWSVLT